MSRADNLFETVGDVIGLFTSYGIIPTDAMVKISPPTDEMFSSSAAIIFSPRLEIPQIMFINYRSVFMRKGPYWDSSGKDFYATLRNFYLETMSSENPIFTMPDEEAVSLYLSYSDKSVGWKARNLRYLEVLGENEGGDSLHKLYACLKCSKYEVGLHSPVLLRLAELLKAYPESTNYQALMLASDADLSLADYPEFEKMPLSYQDKMSHITPPIKTPENWVYDFKLEKLETLEF